MRVLPRAKVVYKITYPNGLIYIGLDLTNTLTYMGSSSIADQIAADLGPELCQDFTIRKTILWSSTTATDAEAQAMEVKLIREHRANDPTIGYNRWPRMDNYPWRLTAPSVDVCPRSASWCSRRPGNGW
jgi:hypothetical protein